MNLVSRSERISMVSIDSGPSIANPHSPKLGTCTWYGLTCCAVLATDSSVSTMHQKASGAK